MFLDVNPIAEMTGEKVERKALCDFTEWQEKMAPIVASPVEVAASAVNDHGRIRLHLAVKFTLLLECDRCAAPLEVSHDEVFDHTVDGTDSESDDEVDSENGIIDLDPVIWDDMLTMIPSRLLCRPDCKGICLNCGKNLNDGPCGCADPRTITIES